MTNKKIIIVAPNLKVGGAEKNIVKLIREWLKYGYVIKLILNKKTGELLKGIPEEVEIINLNQDRLINIIYPLYKYLSNNKPNIIWVNLWPLTSYAIIAWLLTGRIGQIFVTEHNNFEKSYIKKNIFRRIYFRLLLNYTHTYANGVTTVSNGLQYSLIKLVPRLKNKIKTIYNPIVENKKEKVTEEELKSLSKIIWNQEDSFKILTVGEFKTQKNHELLIDALKIIINKKINVNLIILGNGILYEKIRKKIKEMKLEKEIMLPGYQEETEKWYKTADLFILTSNWEGFGNVIVEAMEYGLPIISTNCPHGPSEILADGLYGDLIECNQVNQLVEAIEKNIKLEIKKPIEVNVSRASNYSVEKIAKEYIDLFTKND